MAGYEGSLFDANGPMQFATQVRGIADALDSVTEKAKSFFESTQSGLDNLTQALSNFSGATGGFSPGGRGGGSGWSVGRPNSGGTGGRQGNDMGVGGSGNTPSPYYDMTGGMPVGGYSNFSAGRVAEAAVGVGTGAAQRYQAMTETPALQLGLAAQQGALMGGQSVNAGMYGIANNQMLAASMGDLAIGTSTMQNLFGVNMTGRNSAGGTLGSSVNTVALMNPSVGYTGAAQAMAGMNSAGAYRAQMTLLGTAARMNGQYQSPETMVNDLFSKFPQLQTMDNASFEQDITNGNMYQNLLAISGGDPTMLQTLQNLVRARRQSNTSLPSQMSGGQLRSAGLTYKPATDQLQRQSTTSHTQAQTARGQNQALDDFNRAVQGFTQAVNSLFGGAPSVAYGVGYGTGAASHIGGPLGTALGIGNSLTGGLLGGLLGGGGGGGGMGGGGGGLNPMNLLTMYLGYKGLSKLGGKIPGLGGLFGGAEAAAGDVAGGASLAGDAVGGAAAAAGDAGFVTAGGMATLGLAALPAAVGVGGLAYGFKKLFQNDQNVDYGTGNHGILGGPNSSTPNNLGGSPPISSVYADIKSKNPYWKIVLQAAQKYGIAPTILSAQEYAESGWNPAEVSPTGAFGISQFEPGTAASYGVQRGTTTEAVTSQIMGQAAFMSALMKKYNNNLSSALSAYNAGPAGDWNNSQTKSYVSEIQNYITEGQYDAGSYEIDRTKMALLHKGERVVRSADNTVSSRYGNGAGGVTHHHVHHHFSPGAISVTMPGTDKASATQVGMALGDALVERLSRA